MKHLIDPAGPPPPEAVLKLASRLDLAGGDVLVEAEGVRTRSGPPSSLPRERDGAGARPLRLAYWDVQAHAYQAEQAAEAGIFAGLFGGEAKRVAAGIVHEAKRFAVERVDGRMVEIGVAVRLSVATEALDASIGLTLPNLAAAAQLHSVDTRIGIRVIGFGGALGDLLPAPARLDVETCVEYLNAFREIQRVVFCEAGMASVVPTLLSYEGGD
ncbi:MAG: hypothetical protein V2J24_11015 [Pseudomonadales bacterium]|nr:hypothetical protein [Pseudomonadales bacterium]